MPAPLGASIHGHITNFALVSVHATAVSLCLFWDSDQPQGRVTHEVPLDPHMNRTGSVWHIALPNLDSNMLYGYRVTGPHRDDDHAAQRYNTDAVILDPYASGVLSRRKYGQLAGGNNPTWPQAAAFLPQHDTFDWEGDRPLNLAMRDTVLYEMQVRGFTMDPAAKVSAPGTYEGMTAKLDHLASLGVTALELLPVHEFNELEYYDAIPGSDTGSGPEYRFNAWGYSTLGFFSPMARFSAAVGNGGGGPDLGREVKQLVKAAHARGMEVILDVVYNHTAEGNENGPTVSFRGLDNSVYYMLAPGGEYYNYSGCGNTLNCNHPVVRQMVLDSLKHWVREYHVDGFRFDLGSILTRAPSTWQEGAGALHPGQFMADGAGCPTGTPLADPALIEMISEDPLLRNIKMIAEAWDCDGLKQVGAFPHYGGRWAEWNDAFRDTVRNFMKGSDGTAGAFASALCGSPGVFGEQGADESDWWGSQGGGGKWRGSRGPTASVNFITAHDGFSLLDLVSYNDKHNLANGEDNNDGENHNLSWNCGEEGVSSAPTVNRLRDRQQRNMLAALMVAQGVPMMCMGDEYGHTKHGNNNTYCHDSPLNWYDWDRAERDEQGLLRFTRCMIAFRKAHPCLRRENFPSEGLDWHGVEAGAPDWSDESRLVAFSMACDGGAQLYVAFNASHHPQILSLPRPNEGFCWEVLVDTCKVAPFDFLVEDSWMSAKDVRRAHAVERMWTDEGLCTMLPRSCVILKSVPYHQATHGAIRDTDD